MIVKNLTEKSSKAKQFYNNGRRMKSEIEKYKD